MKIKFFYLFVLLSIECFSMDNQQDKFTEIVNRIEKNILAKNQQKSLGLIDALLLKSYQLSEKQKTILNVLKVEALVDANLVEESLALSKDLDNSALTTTQKIRILINNELAYKLVRDFKRAKLKLDAVTDLYENQLIIKDDLYGKYLYRYSSFYRVQGINGKALQYAEKAYKFGKNNNNPNTTATAAMLLGFLKYSSDLEACLDYLKESAILWKKLEDNASLANYYITMAQLSNSQNNINLSQVYLDSSIIVLNGSRHYNELGYSYQLKKNFFEEKQNLDSVIKYQQKSEQAFSKSNLNNQNIKVKELEINYELKKQQLANEQAVKDLKVQTKQTLWLTIGVVSLLFTLSIILIILLIIKKKNHKIKQQKEEITKNLEEKKVLLKELHHRVKNNLSMMLSLINIQALKTDKKEYKEKLKDLEKRIQTVVVAHNQFLYSTNKDSFSLKTYVDAIINKLVNLHVDAIKNRIEIKDFLVNLDTALPIGIIVNELITNTLKHAKFNAKLQINLHVFKEDDMINLHYKDNGVDTKKTLQEENVGLFLIDTMVKQLQGTYTNKNFKYNIQLQTK
ncbi:sensor histidine kinase [Polaribacter sp. R77954]|uniref:sensor histidine kinase n=1 Tax=Polaribacter sp. R77954 TaxID=3093870 RepID=UPI0037C896AD